MLTTILKALSKASSGSVPSNTCGTKREERVLLWFGFDTRTMKLVLLFSHTKEMYKLLRNSQGGGWKDRYI